MLFNVLSYSLIDTNSNVPNVNNQNNAPTMISISKLEHILNPTNDNETKNMVGKPDLWPGNKDAADTVLQPRQLNPLPQPQNQPQSRSSNNHNLQQSHSPSSNPLSNGNVPDISSLKCTKKCVRKEIHNMSPDEIQAFIKAYLKLAENGVLDTLVQWHINVWTYAHFTSYFLPWHRAFVMVFEQALQSVDPNVCAPYWDHSREAQNPWSSIIWQHIGGDGYGGCIRDGPFKDVRINGQCIQRQFQRTSFVHIKTVGSMVKGYSQFQQFSTNFEVYPHATPHSRIGGNMDGPRSPADPVFWFHHSWVDKVFIMIN